MKKTLGTFIILFLAVQSLYAQEGVAEMNEAAGTIGKTFFSMGNFSYVIAAIIGIFGAIKIYHKWQRGREDITFDILAWGGSCLFMVLVPQFLQLLFGI